MERNRPGGPGGYPKRPKTGGRRKGTPNKSTLRVQAEALAHEKALESIGDTPTTSLLRLHRSRSCSEERKALIREALWYRGELRWILRPVQLEMYADIKRAIRRGESLKYVINSSRRLGKTFTLCVIALEYAIQDGEYPVIMASPTQKAMKKILRPLFRQILKTCPEDLRPEYRTSDDTYRFPKNGAEIQIGGCNNEHEDDLRGTAAGLCLIDEAGMVDNLEYVVEDVLMPQLLTTGGHLIMASTPPKTPAHSFITYIQLAKVSGNYSEYDIYKSGYDRKVIEQFKKEAGGEQSSTWKREYMCQLVVDEESAIVPEWNDRFVQDVPRDPVFFRFFHKYEAMDVGGRDKNVVLFGYYDFPRARLVIEDEGVISGAQMTSRTIARDVKVKERQLWPDMAPAAPEPEQEKWPALNIYSRVADNNNVILLNDLGADFGLHFVPTSKDELLAMVNKVRLYVGAGRVLVHPRCVQLVGCLKYGIWDKNRREFERSIAYGHFDALAALVYLIRNLDESTNPIPADWNARPESHWMGGLPQDQAPEADALKKIFGLR
jgi:hypothetical protein